MIALVTWILLTMNFSAVAQSTCESEVMSHPVCMNRGEALTYCRTYGHSAEAAVTARDCVLRNRQQMMRVGITDEAQIKYFVAQLCLFPRVISTNAEDMQTQCD